MPQLLTKFKDATSLENAYLNLEKMFTKKCQELSEFKKGLSPNIVLDNDNPVKNTVSVASLDRLQTGVGDDSTTNNDSTTNSNACQTNCVTNNINQSRDNEIVENDKIMGVTSNSGQADSENLSFSTGETKDASSIQQKTNSFFDYFESNEFTSRVQSFLENGGEVADNAELRKATSKVLISSPELAKIDGGLFLARKIALHELSKSEQGKNSIPASGDTSEKLGDLKDVSYNNITNAQSSFDTNNASNVDGQSIGFGVNGDGQSIASNVDGQSLGFGVDDQSFGVNGDGQSLGKSVDGRSLGYNGDGQSLGFGSDGQSFGVNGDGQSHESNVSSSSNSQSSVNRSLNDNSNNDFDAIKNYILSGLNNHSKPKVLGKGASPFFVSGKTKLSSFDEVTDYLSKTKYFG